jgi:hypothetical protein
MKLSDTQLVLLSAASQREDGAVVLAPNLKGGAASKVVGKLLRDGKKSRPPRRCRRGAVTMTRGRGRCAVSIPRQSRGLYGLSRSKRLLQRVTRL